MQFYLLLTEQCNLHCPMCIRGKQHGSELDFDKLNCLDLTDIHPSDIVILTGGEPTLYPRIIETMRFFAPKVSMVVITTNGTTSFDAEKLLEIDNLHIQVSIDGSLESHNKIRGKGTFEKTFSFVKKLDSLGIRYSVATVMSRSNMGSMHDLVNSLAVLTNLSYWKVSYEMPFECKNYDQMLSAQEWNKMVDYLISITPFKMKIQKIFPLELYEKHAEELKTTVDTRYHNCGGCNDKIYIYPDFEVYPCTCLTDFSLGNLNNNTLGEILCSRQAMLFKHYEVSPDSLCFTCKFKPLCNGGCIGMSYHYFGKLGRGDIRCPLINRQQSESSISM